MNDPLINELMQETLALASAEQRAKAEELQKTLKLTAQKMNFVWAIKQARKSAGLSQRALARITGIQQHDLCRLEKGETNPTFETQQKLFDALGIEVRYLLKPAFETKSSGNKSTELEFQKSA